MSTECVIDTTLTLRSRHRFDREKRESIRTQLYTYGIDPKEHEHELFVQGNGDNVQYLRLLVPTGSVILSGSGATNIPVVTYVSSHTHADELALTVRTPVNQDSIITVRYRSPLVSCDRTIEFIKQPGLQNFTIQRK